MVAVFDAGDSHTGWHLLEQLPADPDALPERLSAQLTALRVWRRTLSGDPVPKEELAQRAERLRELGETAGAVRLGSLLAETLQESDPAEARRWAEQSVADADRCGTPASRVEARLALSRLLDRDGNHRAADEQLRQARDIAEQHAPERLGAVIVQEVARLSAREQFADALALLDAHLDQAANWTRDSRVNAHQWHAQLLGTLGRIEEARDAFDRALAEVRSTPGPWTADLLFQRARTIDRFEPSGQHLPELVETVAAAREHLSPVAVARACHHLALGYLEHQRFVEAAETLEEALRLLRRSADVDDSHELLLEVRYRLGVAYDNLEEHGAAVEHLGAVADALRDAPPEQQAEVIGHLATAYRNQREEDLAARMFRRAAELWEAAGDVGRACHMLREFALLPHDFEGIGEALAALEHALTLLEGSEQEEHQRLR